MRNASYHYFAIVDFGGHTRHAVWVLFAEIFGERSFVAFFPNKGDAGILLGKYFVKGFLEKSHPWLSIVSTFSFLFTGNETGVGVRTLRRLCVQR